MAEQTVEQLAKERRIYRFFEISVLLKGANAILEIAGGILAFVVSPAAVQSITAYFTNAELGQNPDDVIATQLVGWANAYATASHQEFIALYLLTLGIIKIVLVVALLRGFAWAFPTALAVFGLLALYQLYLLLWHYTLGLLVLTVFDLVVIYFIRRQWQVVKKRRTN